MSFSRRGHGDVFFACGTNEYTAKVTCVERLQKVRLLPPRPADDSHANGTKAARGSNFGSRLSRTPRSWSPAFLRPLRALDRWIASLEAGCARRLLARPRNVARTRRFHESGRPGSNRRRPAWEAFVALAGQGFFGGGSRNGITQYAGARPDARSWPVASGDMGRGGSRLRLRLRLRAPLRA